MYLKLNPAFDGDQLRDQLLENQDCFVRNCENKIGCTSQYFCIAARPKAEVDYLERPLNKN